MAPLPFFIGIGKVWELVKKLSLSEFALLCSPLILIGLGAGVLRVRQHLNPPLDPNAKIILSVAPDPAFAGKSLKNEIVFARTIKASNSPQEGVTIRYKESLVAKGHGHSQSLAVWPITPAFLSRWSIDQGGGGWSRGSSSSSIRVHGDGAELPVWTTQLEWQSEIAAAPRARGGDSRPASSAVIKTLAQLRGATYFKKNLSIPVSPETLNPIQKLEMSPVPEEYKGLRVDTCVKMEFKNSRSKIFRQLVAFDGKTRRVLWSEGAKVDDSRGFSGQYHSTAPFQASDVLLFKLRNVPRSWGKLTLLLDIVFDPRLNPGNDWQSCDKTTLEKLKSQGWLAFSRRVVVRPTAGVE